MCACRSPIYCCLPGIYTLERACKWTTDDKKTNTLPYIYRKATREAPFAPPGHLLTIQYVYSQKFVLRSITYQVCTIMKEDGSIKNNNPAQPSTWKVHFRIAISSYSTPFFVLPFWSSTIHDPRPIRYTTWIRHKLSIRVELFCCTIQKNEAHISVDHEPKTQQKA